MKEEYPISVTEDGIVICFNFEHPTKVRFSIEIIDDDSIDICSNDVQ